MKVLFFAIAAAAMVALFPTSAHADDGTYTMPLITVYGRAPKPLVVIELSRPSAAREAGTAHEGLREKLLADSIPPALRPQQ